MFIYISSMGHVIAGLFWQPTPLPNNNIYISRAPCRCRVGSASRQSDTFCGTDRRHSTVSAHMNWALSLESVYSATGELACTPVNLPGRIYKLACTSWHDATLAFILHDRCSVDTQDRCTYARTEHIMLLSSCLPHTLEVQRLSIAVSPFGRVQM
jgi:hypothetical protein